MFLKGFLRVLGCNPRKRGVFIRLKVETHKTTLFWLLEAQNDVVLEAFFFFFLNQEPQNDVVLI